jgi:hypothetical protein
VVVGVRTQMYSSNQRSEVEASNIDDDGVTAGWYGMVPYSSVAALIFSLVGFPGFVVLCAFCDSVVFPSLKFQ